MEALSGGGGEGETLSLVQVSSKAGTMVGWIIGFNRGLNVRNNAIVMSPSLNLTIHFSNILA